MLLNALRKTLGMSSENRKRNRQECRLPRLRRRLREWPMRIDETGQIIKDKSIVKYAILFVALGVSLYGRNAVPAAAPVKTEKPAPNGFSLGSVSGGAAIDIQVKVMRTVGSPAAVRPWFRRSEYSSSLSSR